MIFFAGLTQPAQPTLFVDFNAFPRAVAAVVMVTFMQFAGRGLVFAEGLLEAEGDEALLTAKVPTLRHYKGE